MNNPNIKKTIRAIALAIVFSGIGKIFAMLLASVFEIELSKLENAIFIFFTTSFLVLLFFPRVFKMPYGKQNLREWFAGIGLYLPDKVFFHILFGILLGIVSLTGMLLGSVLTGKYVFDLSSLSPAQFIFSLTPGIWEEVLFRGVILIVLLQFFKNLKKAFWWQVVIFALCHVSGFDAESMTEVVSVAIIGITFSLAAVKSRALISAIIYHYIHDAFLFLVQNPGGNYSGFEDNMTFYVFFWSAMLLNMMIIVLFTDRLGIRGSYRIYSIDGSDDTFPFLTATRKRSAKADKFERIALLIYAFTLLATLFEKSFSELSLNTILLSIVFLMNIAGFILYKKIGKRMISILFLINSIGSIVSGYEHYLSGTQRVHVFFYLIGVLYFLLAIYVLIMHNKKQESVS